MNFIQYNFATRNERMAALSGQLTHKIGNNSILDNIKYLINRPDKKFDDLKAEQRMAAKINKVAKPNEDLDSYYGQKSQKDPKLNKIWWAYARNGKSKSFQERKQERIQKNEDAHVEALRRKKGNKARKSMGLPKILYDNKGRIVDE